MATGFEAFALYGTISLVGAQAAIAQLKQVELAAAGTATTLSRNVAAIGTTVSNIGAKLRPIGIGLLGVSAAALAVGASTVKSAMSFEKSMVEAYAVVENLTEDQKKRMQEAALTITRTSRFSADEIAANYQILARAGMEAEQSIAAIPVTVKFAQAANADLNKGTEDLIHTQNAMGLASTDAAENQKNLARVADVLVAADIKAVGSALDYADALTNGLGPAMRFVNMDLEEGTAVLMAMAQQGDLGSAAGTHLQMVMRDVQRATIKNREMWKKYNVTVYDTNGNLRNMADIIGDLEKGMAGMSDQQKRVALMEMGFQDRSVKAILSLLGLSDAIRDYEKYLREAAGTTDEVSKKQLQNLADQFKIVKNRIDAAKISIGTSLMPTVERFVSPGGPLDKLISGIENAASSFANLSPATQEGIINAVLNAGKLGLAILALKPLGAILTGLSGALEWLGLQLAGGTLLTQIGLFAAKWVPVLAVLTAIYEVMRMIFLMKNPELLPTTSDTVAQAQQDAYSAIETKPVIDRYGGAGDVGNVFVDRTKLIPPPSEPLPWEESLGVGGIITQPTHAFIGEAGPEAVIPLDRAGSMMGGHFTMDINVNVTGGELDEARLTRVAEAGLMDMIARSMRVNNDRYASAMSERRMFR